MENLDDLMRQKYDNDDPAGRFEFREEYWEQARALIEADEARRRKKRRWLLWWTFAGALLIGAAVCWWPLATGDGRQSGSMEQRIDSTVIMPESSSPVTNTSPLSTIPEQSSKDPDATNKMSATANIPGQKLDNATAFTDKNNLTNNKKQQKAPLFNPKNGQGNKIAPVAGTTGNYPKGFQNDLSATAQTAVLSKGARALETESNRTSAAGQETLATGALPASTGFPGSENANNTAIPAPEEASKSLEKILEQLFTLPLPFPPVSSERSWKHNMAPTETVPMANQIKPVKDQRFSLGVSAAAMAYKASPDRRWLGFSGAAVAAYQWNKTWSASVGLGVRYQPGNWIDSTGEALSSLRYSFGFASIISEQRAVGLLSLEIPIAATWHRRAFSLEAGVAPGRLLYALNRFKQTTESSFEAEKVTRNRLERGDLAPFGKFYANTFAGAAWRFTRNTSISLRGNYRFGAIVNASTEDPGIKGGASVELGIRWMVDGLR